MMMKRAFAILIAVLAWQGFAGAQQPQADSIFLDMRQAFVNNNTARLDALLPLTRGHILEPMALYWHTKSRLATATEAQVQAALQKMPGSYWEDRLRNDWLLLLGQRRQWAAFEAEWAKFRMRDDNQLQCYALMLDAVAGRKTASEVAAEVQTLWHAQPDAEDGCATAAQALLQSGHLKPLAVWQRARLAMDANKPRALLQAVRMVQPEWVPKVQSMLNNPAAYLDDKFTAVRTPTKEMVTLAVIGLARDNAALAAQELQHTRWLAQLTQEEISWAWGAIGRRAAQDLQPQALSYFSHAQDRQMHDEQLAWKARAGLRAGAWGAVHDAILAMSQKQREQPVWVYWRAQAIQNLKTSAQAAAQARALYESIASPHGFYEQLALQALGRPITASTTALPLSAQETAAAQNNPGLQRALAAIALGVRSEGVREWHYSVALHSRSTSNDRELLAAAALACRHQIWDRCINTSARTTKVFDYSQRFPMPHQAEVVQRSSAIGLDPAYVYGLIRQESRFVIQARSSVGASGLMQVMPATASWTAKKLGWTNFRGEQINDLNTNITIGTAYLKMVLDDFEGSLPLAAAAYNAGPGRAGKWRNGPRVPAEIWAENIPFSETRDYVKQVLSNTTLYAALITGRPQSLRDRLGMIGPRSNATPINPELP